jgi:Trk K+ transport system NAD-binding subunit
VPEASPRPLDPHEPERSPSASRVPAIGAADPLPCRLWTGHVIVCGLRGVGLRIVEQLHASGTAVVIVDDDPDPLLARVAATLGVPHLQLSPHATETLYEAGLAGAVAVACVQRDDLRTLETALLVHELSPETRVVVNLDNPAVGRGVADVTGAGSVLDVAGLFAPSVVETCMREDAHRLDLDGEQLVVAEVTVAETSTLRKLFADLAPMGVAPADGGDLVICPGRDHPVLAGDRVWVLGTTQQLDEAGLRKRRRSDAVIATGQSGPLSLLRRGAATIAAATDHGLRLAAAAVVLLIVTSTLLLRFTYHPADSDRHLRLLDALYFTVETISTVGFGDFSFSGQSQWLEAFGVLLILLGVAMVTTLFTLITNLLVSRRIEQSLGRGRVTGMAGHIVLIGLGAVGMRVLEGLLARGQEVVVVEREESNRYLNQARGLGVRVVIGDATLPTTLELVNLATAAAVAILTSDDLTNIEAGLAVRDRLGERWLDVPIVLRVFDRALGHRVQQSFHFHHVWSTSAIAAPWFIGAALGLDVLATFYVDHEPFLLARFTVAPGGGLAGVAMRELSARMRVVAIRRAGDTERLEHPPRRDTRFAPGDQAYLAGPNEELLEVLRHEQQTS